MPGEGRESAGQLAPSRRDGQTGWATEGLPAADTSGHLPPCPTRPCEQRGLRPLLPELTTCKAAGPEGHCVHLGWWAETCAPPGLSPAPRNKGQRLCWALGTGHCALHLSLQLLHTQESPALTPHQPPPLPPPPPPSPCLPDGGQEVTKAHTYPLEEGLEGGMFDAPVPP